jgi:hypothetical protein
VHPALTTHRDRAQVRKLDAIINALEGSGPDGDAAAKAASGAAAAATASAGAAVEVRIASASAQPRGCGSAFDRGSAAMHGPLCA